MIANAGDLRSHFVELQHMCFVVLCGGVGGNCTAQPCDLRRFWIRTGVWYISGMRRMAPWNVEVTDWDFIRDTQCVKYHGGKLMSIYENVGGHKF